MNQENQFSIDVKAESQAISPLIQEGLSTPSEFINVQPDMPLPDPILFKATEIDLSETVKAEASQIAGLDFDVKMQVEEVYERTEQLEEKMGEMYGGFQDLYENVKNKWLPIREKDEFEERPTIEPRNLIFEARRDKMSMPPQWG